MWSNEKGFSSPAGTPVVSEKSNKVAPKPAPKGALGKKVSGSAQRKRMDDAISASGG